MHDDSRACSVGVYYSPLNHPTSTVAPVVRNFQVVPFISTLIFA